MSMLTAELDHSCRRLTQDLSADYRESGETHKHIHARKECMQKHTHARARVQRTHLMSFHMGV
jgi:hypothetical protein